MKHQLIHRVGRYHWNIILESGYGHLAMRDLIHATIKSNCPEYQFYPVRSFTSEIEPEQAASFLVWVRSQPIHQFINVVKYLLLGYRSGFGWADHLILGQRYYDMAARGEKIEAEDVAAYKLFQHESKEKEEYQQALRGKGQVGTHP